VEVAVKRLSLFPLLCLAALLPAAAPPARPSSAEVARLLRQLGDDDFDVREAATARLLRAGEAALPALHKALASADLEVRHRARRIVAALEARLSPELRLTGHTVRLWDATTGKELRKMTGHARDKLTGHTNIITSARFSPDGKRLLSASYDGTVRIWDVKSGKELKQIQAHKPNAYCAAFSPDGKRIVSCGEDHAVRVWDAQSGKQLRKYEGHGPVAFFPDGKRIAATSLDGTARVWRAPR
jgi:hypothetical protein